MTYREFDLVGNRVMLCDSSMYCKFRENDDGTISPTNTKKDLLRILGTNTKKDLVLGFGKCLQSKHGFNGDRDQCILVPRDDARRLVVYAPVAV